MAAKDKYVAYVGTYTHENSVGIHVYDVDVNTGVFKEQSVAPINNPSYLLIYYLISIDIISLLVYNILIHKGE